MLLAVAIHKDRDSAYGVSIPDVPGCFSYGDTIEMALSNARQAVMAHLETLLDLGQSLDLQVTPVEKLQRRTEHRHAIWGVIDIDLSLLDSKPERVNISLPKFVLNKIDRHVYANHDSRSGFLARAALAALENQK